MPPGENPKAALGAAKLPLSLWPETATALGSVALYEGMLKYGRLNWRATCVSARTYVDALRRHVAAWYEGEDNAPDSGLPHLAHALACLAILVDAQVNNTLVDDRQYTPIGGAFADLIAELTQSMRRLETLHAGKEPKHYDASSSRT